MAKMSALLMGVSVGEMAFRMIDVRDDSGMMIRLRIAFRDLAEVLEQVTREPVFQDFLVTSSLQDKIPAYLAKTVAAGGLHVPGSMFRTLYIVQVCAWKTRQRAAGQAVLFLEQRPWITVIGRYAADSGVEVVPVQSELNLRAKLRRLAPAQFVGFLRLLRYRLTWKHTLTTIAQRRRIGREAVRNEPDVDSTQVGKPDPRSAPKIAVEYYGQLNLNHAARHSELFFWQQSPLNGSDMLVTFSGPAYFLDEPTWTELKEHDIGAVVLHPGATNIPTVPVFKSEGRRTQNLRLGISTWRGKAEWKWLAEQVNTYQTSREYWSDLLAAYGVKVFVTWYKNDATHLAICDALQSLGGVTAIYQRSYESVSSPLTAVDVDLLFGYSQYSAQIERGSNSRIRYHVATGYLGDHRFPLVLSMAQTTRHRLRRHGATKIVALFDENALDDERWNWGHQPARESYAFILEKVLSEPWLGLVVKPKVPRTLRRRLGPVAELLERAEETGRCYVYEDGGTIQGSYPPAIAGLAADVAVHIHINAGSAAIDAALAGVPTLVLDREGWSVSPFYRLGAGQVVFTDWEELWEACVRQWSAPDGSGKLGDWSPMLDDLDPFRDGRAAERMGTYIQWLMQGFKVGLDRETVMAEAAERYCSIWGSDKITQLSGEPTRPLATDPSGRT